MKKFIIEHRRLVISLLVVAIFISGGCAIIFQKNISGKIAGYSQPEESIFELLPDQIDKEYFYYECTNNYHMTKETADDMVSNANNYSIYLLHIYIHNTTNHKICNLEANLNGTHDNVWLDTSSLCEWPLDLGPSEVYEDNMFIIIKTENYTEKEVEDLIRSIKINILASNYANTGLYCSATLSFDN